MVDVTKPIVNPRLSEALAALHRENTPANQDRALRELMTQAHLLAPVVLTPAPPPAVSGQTTLEQNTAIQFQLISSQEGRPFFPAFTNWGELRKLCGPRDQQTLVLTFDDYAFCRARRATVSRSRVRLSPKGSTTKPAARLSRWSIEA